MILKGELKNCEKCNSENLEFNFNYINEERVLKQTCADCDHEHDRTFDEKYFDVENCLPFFNIDKKTEYEI